jgi:predicted Rossmann fold nucleotide-binding protein DprA/Smf involved in DNA uptake
VERQYYTSTETFQLPLGCFFQSVMYFPRSPTSVPSFWGMPLGVVIVAPNQLIKRGAKLVTNAEDVIEGLPTTIWAALVQAEAVEAEQRNPLAVEGLNPKEQKIYGMLSAEQSKHIDELVENSGLNSSGVLATLFSLEMKGIIRQLPGKRFSKILL